MFVTIIRPAVLWNRMVHAFYGALQQVEHGTLLTMKKYSNSDKLVFTPDMQGTFIKGSPHYKRHKDCTCPALLRTKGRFVDYPGTFPCPVHGHAISQSI